MLENKTALSLTIQNIIKHFGQLLKRNLFCDFLQVNRFPLFSQLFPYFFFF